MEKEVDGVNNKERKVWIFFILMLIVIIVMIFILLLGVAKQSVESGNVTKILNLLWR